MTAVAGPKPPKGLAAEGRALWRVICADAAGQGLELDARELVWLRHAAKLADRIGELETAMAAQQLIVEGHAKQPVANPLLGEIRQNQALLAQTLGRLRLEVAESSSGQAVTGNRHRAAALARWGAR